VERERVVYQGELDVRKVAQNNSSRPPHAMHFADRKGLSSHNASFHPPLYCTTDSTVGSETLLQDVCTAMELSFLTL